MFCPNCGAPVAEDGRFCLECGMPVAGGTAGGQSSGPAPGSPAVSPAVSSTVSPTELPKPSGRPVVSAHEHPPVAAVVQTDVGAKDGVSKCPFCGSSDIALNIATGNLRCNYCHREIAPEVDPLDYDIGTLTGVVMGSAAQDIPADTATMITLRCTGCGAEVVVNTAETLQARCHWCRSALSINQQIPNGAVPDALIPFRLPKQKAQELIWGFVGNRQFYAHPRFKAEFNINNIMGVYLPYMVIDVNAHADLRGQGEHLVRKYGDNDNPLYDADLYNVGRAFDLHVDDLAVEANAQRMHQVAGVTTNNIINSILPYPLKNTVRFNANYLRGFTSEKRDVNRVHIAPIVDAQVRDIARVFAKRDATFYNRGIHWDQVAVETRGQLWKTVYLPVWLYSYLEVKSSGQRLLHYVACNAVTGETMGSVPLHMPRLAAVTALIETVCAVIGIGLTGLFLWLSF